MAKSKTKTDSLLNGHPKFYDILDDLAGLHDKKNFDYASGGNPLGNFYRVSNFFSMYPGLKLSDPVVISAVYAMKQLDAALWLKSNGHAAKIEGVIERLKDVAVYSILEMIMEEEKNEF
jgi:hypothetical protein